MFDIFQFFTFLHGVPYAGTLAAAIIIIAALVLAKVFYFIFHRGLRRVARKTKTDLDNVLIDVLERPIYIGIIIAGIFFASLTVEFLSGFRDQITQGFTVIAILWVAFFAVRIIKAVLEWYSMNIAAKTKTKIDDSVMPILRKILEVFIYAIALIVILGEFGVEITPLIASLGIAGLAIALALQDTLSNLFAGTYLVGDKTVKVGDYIEVEGSNGEIQGYIDHVGWRSVRIRTTYSNVTDNIIIIPNSQLAQSVITNYSYPVERTLLIIPVGVSYESDLKNVEKITKAVADNIKRSNKEECTQDFQPMVRFREFGDSNINFDVILKVEHARFRAPIRHEFMKELKSTYDRKGVEISWPVRKVYVHNVRKTRKK